MPFAADDPGDLSGLESLGMELPAGRVVDGRYWLSDEGLESPWKLWASLVDRFDETGLWPVLWLSADRDRTATPSLPPSATPAELLRTAWDQFAGELEDEVPGYHDPHGLEFPGLTPRQTERSHDVIADLSARTGSAGVYRLALVPVRHPSEAINAVGWDGTTFGPPADVGAVVGSWEDSLGAVLVSWGPGVMELYVERPPTSGADWWSWTAERAAFNMLGDDFAAADTFADAVAFSRSHASAAVFTFE